MKPRPRSAFASQGLSPRVTAPRVNSAVSSDRKSVPMTPSRALPLLPGASYRASRKSPRSNVGSEMDALLTDPSALENASAERELRVAPVSSRNAPLTPSAVSAMAGVRLSGGPSSAYLSPPQSAAASGACALAKTAKASAQASIATAAIGSAVFRTRGMRSVSIGARNLVNREWTRLGETPFRVMAVSAKPCRFVATIRADM